MDPALLVYLLASRPRGTLYAGATNNLVRRLWEHRTGAVEGFTREYGVQILVHSELHETAEAAIQREKRLKRWRRAWKIELIEKANPTWCDLPSLNRIGARRYAPTAPWVPALPAVGRDDG